MRFILTAGPNFRDHLCVSWCDLVSSGRCGGGDNHGGLPAGDLVAAFLVVTVS